MSDALSRLIRLSSRHNLPVIVHDSHSGESAVLMNLDEYEKLAEIRENFCDPEDCRDFLAMEDDDEEDVMWGDEEDEKDTDLKISELEERNFGDNILGDKNFHENFSHFNEESHESSKKVKFSGMFEGKENFPTEENAFYDQKMQIAHEIHRDKADINWDKDPQEEVRYEPNQNPNSMFPAFHPQDENEETDEEPIFFEEPV